jgi:hypothetical protein
MNKKSPIPPEFSTLGEIGIKDMRELGFAPHCLDVGFKRRVHIGVETHEPEDDRQHHSAYQFPMEP